MKKSNYGLLQKKFCDNNDLIMLAPLSGACWHCGNNIWELLQKDYIENYYIQQCPSCGGRFDG